MSERTTIGGTVYETVGSSSSNLLLRCNGTARIQWGSKLIDLIKNGKIAAGDSSTQVSVIADISEIQKDGIYVLETDTSPQLWICTSDKQFNITGADLYISASTKQDTTADQQKQALENIGMYYNTLDDVRLANIKDGLVYVLSEKKLYTIQESVIEEFEAKLRTIAVEQQEEQGEVINDALKITLSIAEQEYVIIQDKLVRFNQPIQIGNHCYIGSENADETRGYRLYIDGDASCLDVDRINVREGIEIPEYTEITFSDLLELIETEGLVEHEWYLITDYQNHWKLPANNQRFNRPILLRAFNKTSLYKEGYLYKDRAVVIHYDFSFRDEVYVDKSKVDQENNPSHDSLPELPPNPDLGLELPSIPNTIAEDSPELDTPLESTEYTVTKARGRITWMRDSNGNEANFDFLDYTDSEGKPLTTLHYQNDNTGFNKSIFPRYSSNNKLTISNLKGITLKDKILDVSDDTATIDFKIPDSEKVGEGETLPSMEMCNNVLNVTGDLTVDVTCQKFNNNTLLNVKDVQILKNIDRTSFKSLESTNIIEPISDSQFGIVRTCNILCSFNNVIFKDLITCSFGNGQITNVTSKNNLSGYTFTDSTHPILFDITQEKELKVSGSDCQVTSDAETTIPRGTIIMYSGLENSIPTGWALCDGGTYEYNGKSVTTPNLVNRFIKAAASFEDIKAVDNPDVTSDNKLTLLESHLPKHSHPHQEHDHTITGLTGTIANSGNLSVQLSNSNYAHSVNKSNTDVVSSISTEGVSYGTASVIQSVSNSTQGGTATGGDHTHTITISGGTISKQTSTEATKSWTNQAINIEPNYYYLLFIMKL